MIIPPGYYSSIDDVIAKMNELVDIEKGFKDNVKFSYDSLSRKVTVHLQNNLEIDLGNIGYMLGFQSTSRVISKTTTAEREANLEHGFHDLYIYCDIVKAQYVGDSLVPILRIILVEGMDGQRVNRSYLSAESSLRQSRSI